MYWSDIFSLSRNAIKSNKLRAYLTIAIIAVGITALISILTVIEVLKWNIYNNLNGMGANTFTIMSNKKMGKKSNENKQTNIQVISLLDAKKFTESYELNSVISTSFLAENGATVSYANIKTSPNVIVMATDDKYSKVSGSNFIAGRNFSNNDLTSNSNQCVLGFGIAKKLFYKAENAENKLIKINNITYHVIGVLESKGASLINRMDNMTLVSIGNATKIWGFGNKSCVISVKLDGLKNMNFAMGEAEGLMRSIKNIEVGKENNFVVSKNDELANTLISNIKYVTISASVIGFITLLGAAIGLMNIMLVSVAERTREIGLIKSVGATNEIIKKQFLLEAIWISIIGGAIGIVLGILMGNVLSLLFGSPFVIPWVWILAGLFICIIVGLGAGIYPAIKASKLNPIDSLRYE